eukprot:scaffold65977_cov75-Phaeocystis_antarctica.AAC.3
MLPLGHKRDYRPALEQTAGRVPQRGFEHVQSQSTSRRWLIGGTGGNLAQYGPSGKHPSSAPKTTVRFRLSKRSPKLSGGHPPHSTSRASTKKRIRSLGAASA